MPVAKPNINVLVTGGAGFIGSHVVDLLVTLGCNVTVFDSYITGNPKNVNKKAKFEFVDMGYKENVDHMKRIIQKKKISVVFHLAALPNVQQSIDNISETHNSTLSSTVNLLEAISGTDVEKLIFSSSSAIYGNTGDLPSKETSPIDLITPYALQKWTSEEYIKIFSKIHKVNCTCLRYFNVFGERMPDSGPYSFVISLFNKQKKNGTPLTITNDGEQRRDFVYVKDVAEANYLAMVNCKDSFIIYNVGSGKNYSINEIADTFEHPKMYIGNRLEAKETLGDCSKARFELGWNPTIEVVEWIKNGLTNY